MNPIYPPETSLIPITVALARFAEEVINQEGWLAIRSLGEGWYPYWYLGVPYRFLTGPVIPAVEFLLHKVFPNVSLFTITICLIVVSFIASAVGWGMLVKRISIFQFSIFNYILLIFLLLILPWRFYSSLTLGEVSLTIARNLLPFALVAFWSYLKKKGSASAIWAVITGTFLLLINTSILPILVVGLAALTLARSFKEGKFRRVFKNIKLFLFLVACYLLLVTLWYTPGYWLTQLTNPSVGGASGIKVILRIFDILRAGVPLFLAVIAVYFSGKVKRRFAVFTLIWILTFGFLTIFRFIGDPDFWMDWTSWLYELEVGVALIIASNFQFSISNFQLNPNAKIKNLTSHFLLLTTLFILPFYFVWRINLALGKPALFSTRIPEGVASLEKLAELAGNDRVFLSGSTVFWSGSIGPLLNQVRGGVDQAATHPFWHYAAYQLREGEDPKLARVWLNSLGVSWVLVHTDPSKEFYHDFRNVDKWAEVGDLVWAENGDEIYRIPDSNFAWAVDLKKLREAKAPKDGKDVVALEKYLSSRLKSLTIKKIEKGYLVENQGKAEVVQVAITYSRGWKAYSSKGNSLRVEEDQLGNLLIFTSENQEVFLRY